ncbi:Sir2 family NAD-dependent protein deacetylase [Parvibaculaceae bacterium PLY_AMNH_Bact1]|nr:Sir2 family NAD-dependent protein deacetylase [Parvibaculaceae bacterium PLY_AMNH_Bact1]
MSGELKALIESSRRAVVFTGAGISTESGIPDFRSPGGLWTKMAPIDFRDFMASEEMRVEAWRRKFAMDGSFAAAEPNKGHMAVAKLVDTGKVTHVITQNVDNLHQNSGVPTDKVIELHGNSTYATCLNCGARYELAEIRSHYEENGKPQDCQFCSGILKSATISFGQAMPEAEMERATEATLECDLFIAIGSSLQVYPAAGFPIMAKKNGAKLVILNREETELDGLADLVVHEEIGPTLAPIVQLN